MTVLIASINTLLAIAFLLYGRKLYNIINKGNRSRTNRSSTSTTSYASPASSSGSFSSSSSSPTSTSSSTRSSSSNPGLRVYYGGLVFSVCFFISGVLNYSSLSSLEENDESHSVSFILQTVIHYLVDSIACLSMVLLFCPRSSSPSSSSSTTVANAPHASPCSVVSSSSSYDYNPTNNGLHVHSGPPSSIGPLVDITRPTSSSSSSSSFSSPFSGTLSRVPRVSVPTPEDDSLLELNPLQQSFPTRA